MPSDSSREGQQRDSISLRIIGAFFVGFSILVLVGTFWEERSRAMVVNVAAGVILLLVGCGMVAWGRRLRPR